MTEATVLADANAFSDWLKSGTTPSCVYHRGCSAHEIEPAGRKEVTAEILDRQLANQEASLKAKLAWEAATARKVYLLQRRVSDGVFDYIAVRAEKKVPLRFAAGLAIE